MRKIPTLFLRDPEDPRRVTREVHPACDWVPGGAGRATRKYDGTCVMHDGVRWWARREVKTHKTPPPNYVTLQVDGVTGKTVGWEPAEQSPFLKYLLEAAVHNVNEGFEDDAPWEPGTFELIGPKINGNPGRLQEHRLVRHTHAEKLNGVPRDFDGLAAYLAGFDGEGIVWHHPDGRMAKLKRRDFPRPVRDER